MSDITSRTMQLGTLAELAEQALARTEWWRSEDEQERCDLALPRRVIDALHRNGIDTVEQLKAAGPLKIKEIPEIGKLAYQQIVALLRALDRENNGGGQS